MLVASAAQPAQAAPTAPVIETVVGTGDRGNTGDGGPALEATLERPQSLTTARDGTLYVVSGHRVRAVAADGTVSTVYAGKASKPDGLGGIAVGRDGTVYVADTDGNTVHAVDPEKRAAEPVAGTGKPGSDGAANGDGGPATKARLDEPEGLAVGSGGTLYIADAGHYQIRAVDPKTGRISSVLDSDGAAWHGSATGLAVAGGKLYVSETYDDTVTAIDLDEHTTTVVVDDTTPGLSGTTFFEHPTDLAVGADGRLYIACTAEVFTAPRSNIVYALDLEKGRIEPYAGGAKRAGLGDGGPALGATIGGPNHVEVMGVATDAKGTVYVADTLHNRVRAVRAKRPAERTTHAEVSARTIATVAGGGEQPEDDEEEEGRFYRDVHRRQDVHLTLPADVAVDEDGTVYIADTGNDRVRAVDPADGQVRTIAGMPEEPTADSDDDGDGGRATEATLHRPTALALGPGRTLYVAEAGLGGGIRVIDLAEGTIDTLSATDDTVDPATDLAVGENGVLYVLYQQGERICAVRPGDVCRTIVGGEDETKERDTRAVSEPSAIAVDRNGDLLVAGGRGSRIVRLDPETGKLSTIAGVYKDRDSVVANQGSVISGDGGPAVSADLGLVSSIDVGPDGTIYLTDAANHRVRAVDRRTGVIRAVAGTGTYRSPEPGDVTRDGYIRNDGGAFAGDGGPASRAKLDEPQAVTAGPAGVLYVADTGNDRIRAIGDVDLPEGEREVGPLPFTVGLVLGALLLGALWFRRRQRVSSARIR